MPETKTMVDPPLLRRLLPIIYEDDDLMAVAKPAGLDAGRLPKSDTDGVAEIVAALRGLHTPWEPANRLSRYESGILLLGKNTAIVRHIRHGLRTLRIEQEYVAVVLGKMSQPHVSIGPQHGRSRGRGRKKAGHAPTRAAATAAIQVIPDTTLTPLYTGPKRTLVRCRTNVETTHSLRAQLRSLRLRALGDVIQNQTGRPISHDMTCLHLARIAFHHPGAGRKLHLNCRPPESFQAIADGARDASRPLHAALVRRLPLLVDPTVNASRLLTGDFEDVPGLVAERYGQVVIMQLLQERQALTDALPDIARWYRDTLHVQAVYLKRSIRRGKDGTGPTIHREPADLATAELLYGKPVPDEIEIHEGDLRFTVRPRDPLSVGLFLDHRDNRRRVRELAEGKDVLNLFAYTCGFSLAAALGGATSTVSVDLSPKHLDWGRANFALNGVKENGHHFVQADAFQFLERAQQNGQTFDLVILDPPSFAHGRKRGQDFSVARDLPALVRASLAVLRPECVMIVSTNLRRMPLSALKECVKRGAGRRRARALDAPSLPVDFAVDPDHAKTVFVQVE